MARRSLLIFLLGMGGAMVMLVALMGPHPAPDFDTLKGVLTAAGAPAARMVWLETPHPNPTTLDWLRLGGDVVRSWLAAEGLLD